ncbi:MAG: biosynthetic-type acetolactate synthase large subunit [Coriobacteriales bacterium]|nr:biosynthetic-type acetolactate synthase large subunit [Coriobacteriales bacterium]
MSGAQAIVAALEAEGVELIFGYPGGQALQIYDALYDSQQIRHILARHEQGAVHEADGYARASGRTGVVVVTSGPGATNTVTGIATAYMDSVPLVVICGQVSSSVIGTDAFQESDITGITMPIVKHSYLLQDVADLPRTLREAFYLANSGRPGPVLIDVPSDIAAAELHFTYPDEVNMPSYKPTLKGNPRQIRQAASMITDATRPLIYAGGGIIASGASPELAELAELIQAPVVTTLLGKGAYPASSPLNLGMFGMHGSKYANYAVSAADLVIAVGARFSDRDTGRLASFAREANVVHIDIDPAEIGKNRASEVPIVGDAKGILAALSEQLRKLAHTPRTADWLAQIAIWQADHPFYHPGLATPTGSIAPEGVLDRLSELLDPAASIVTTEVGQHQMWAAQHIQRELPRSFLTSGGLGTMGYGLPAAIGAKLACPDKLVLCVAGDGSLQMNSQEMATAAVSGADVKVLLLNNSALGMVHQWQQLFYDKRYSASLLEDNPNFVKLAEAYSWTAQRVTQPEDVEAALQWLLASEGPALLEVRIDCDEDVFPMLAPGSPLDAVIGAVNIGALDDMIDGKDWCEQDDRQASAWMLAHRAAAKEEAK